jgi:ubiquitin-conjugating enzyme E2 M
MLILFSDINDLSLPKTCKIEFPDPDDLLNFKLVIAPDEVCVK